MGIDGISNMKPDKDQDVSITWSCPCGSHTEVLRADNTPILIRCEKCGIRPIDLVVVDQSPSDIVDVNIFEQAKEEPKCGKIRAGGWGQISSECIFKAGHEKDGTPCSWVIQ